MGIYDYTCMASNLPIGGGDAVRFFVLQKNPYADEDSRSWVPRTLPLKAHYNTYGSIEQVETPELQRLLQRGLEIDMVEHGVGDNEYHDHATSRKMPFRALLGALNEGRVHVHRLELCREAIEAANKSGVVLSLPTLEIRESQGVDAPDGIPNISKVERILRPRNKGKVSRFLVDEPQYGTVRVRFALGGCPWRKDAEHLKRLQKLFLKYSTMVCAGEGQDNVELIIRPAPSTIFYVDPPTQKHLPLQATMIREDVWQALLRLKIPAYSKLFGFKDFHERLKKSIKKQKSDVHESDQDMRWLVGHPGDVHFRGEMDVAYHTHLQREISGGKLTPSYIQALAEYGFVFYVLSELRVSWTPGQHFGPPCGEWKVHHDFQKELAKICKEVLRKEEEEYGTQSEESLEEEEWGNQEAERQHYERDEERREEMEREQEEAEQEDAPKVRKLSRKKR